jgi:hypothetical protein
LHLDDDETLHPQGELAQHLISMAQQKPINILQYIQSLAGTSPLFPTEYPTPPPPGPETGPEPIESPSRLIELTTEVSHLSVSSLPSMIQPTITTTTYSDEDLLWSYLLFTCNQNSKVAQQCLNQKSLPGPKATPFRSSHLSLIQQAPDSYVVCEKTDGDRAILVISPMHQEIYLVYRNHHIERFDLSDQKRTLFQTLHGISIFDGELVSRYSASNPTSSESCAAFLCFDAVFIDGEFIGNQPNCNLMTRMVRAKEWFKQQSDLIVDSLYLRHHATIQTSSNSLLLKCKDLFLVRNIQEVISRMVPHHPLDSHASVTTYCEESYWGWVYGDSPSQETPTAVHQEEIRFPHLSDGLVFTPTQATYYNYLAIKWKPCHMITNDYWISLQDLRKLDTSRKSPKDHQVRGYLPTSNNSRSVRQGGGGSDSMIAMSQVMLSSEQIKEILQSHQQSQCHSSQSATQGQGSHLIAECFYDKRSSVWRVYKIRYDKATSNSLPAAWSNLEVISEGLELHTLMTLIQQLPSSTLTLTTPAPLSSTALLSSSSQLETIDHHYNQIQIQRHTGSRDQRIAMHRKVMNWSKACLLQQVLLPSSSSSSVSGEQYRSLIDQLLSQLHLNSNARRTSVPNLLETKSSHARGGKKRGGTKLQINVVDLACGRGGDVKKFTSKSVTFMHRFCCVCLDFLQ